MRPRKQTSHLPAARRSWRFPLFPRGRPNACSRRAANAPASRPIAVIAHAWDQRSHHQRTADSQPLLPATRQSLCPFWLLRAYRGRIAIPPPTSEVKLSGVKSVTGPLTDRCSHLAQSPLRVSRRTNTPVTVFIATPFMRHGATCSHPWTQMICSRQGCSSQIFMVIDVSENRKWKEGSAGIEEAGEYHADTNKVAENGV